MFITPSSLYQKKGGFTLIELIITIIIMSFAALIITPYLTAITHHPDPVLREQAIALGQAMMDEILAKKWDENSPNGGGPICTFESPNSGMRTSFTVTCTFSPASGTVASTIGTIDAGEALGADQRAQWDDVDDYDGVNEPGGPGNTFYDQTGNALVGPFANFTRSVRVDYINSDANPITATDPTGTATPTDSKRIVVTVTSPLGETFELVAIACNF